MASSALGFTLGDATHAVLNSYVADPTILIGGTDRTASVLEGDAEFVLALGQPGVARLTAYGNGWTPETGQFVQLIADGASGTVLWFTGTITQVVRSIDPRSTRLLYSLTVADYRWLFDRYSTQTGRYYSQGINNIVRKVIKLVNRDFTTGYFPSSLGDLDLFEIYEERPSAILTRLAQAAGAYWEIDANRNVSIFKTPDHKSGGTVTVSNTSNNIADFRWSDELTDIATRVRVIAAGTTLRASVAASATNYLEVYDLANFDLDGGTVYVGTDLVTYGSTTTVPGAEKLVTISGLGQDWPAGTSVRPVITVNDTSAQTALATKIGSGFSGIATRVIDDDTLTAAEAAGVAAGDLSLLSAGVPMLTGTMVEGVHTDAEHCWPGATISVSLTSPVTLSGTWRIQRVTLRPRNTAGGTVQWIRQFVAAPVGRGTEVLDLLERLS
jgi:hypothetical protein